MGRRILLFSITMFLVLGGLIGTLDAKSKIKIMSTTPEIKNVTYELRDKIIVIKGTFKFIAQISGVSKFYVRISALNMRNIIVYNKDHPLSGLEGKFTATIEYDSSIVKVILSTGSYHRRINR